MLKRGAPTAEELKKRSAATSAFAKSGKDAPKGSTPALTAVVSSPSAAQLIPAISDAAGPDPHVIEENAAHPDQAEVLDDAAVEDGAVAHADIYKLDQSWVYGGSAYHTDRKPLKQDLAAGKAALAKSGYKGEKVTFIVDSIRPNVDAAGRGC